MAETDPEEFEREEEQAAAAEAGAIGGRVSYDPPLDGDGAEVDEAQRPLIEGGEGESEGFELAERDLEEHASHGDQHAARRIIEDAEGFDDSEDGRAAAGGEPDTETEPDL